MDGQVTVTGTPASDDTTAFLTKVLTAIILAPKINALLMQLGVQIDPTLLSVALSGILHKLHLLIRQETGWEWL